MAKTEAKTAAELFSYFSFSITGKDQLVKYAPFSLLTLLVETSTGARYNQLH